MISDILFSAREDISAYLNTELGRTAYTKYMPEIQELLEKMHALQRKLDDPREAA